MRSLPDEPLPIARQDPLVVNEFHGEVLVYDPDSHDAYCLNPTSALVWKKCDGRTTISETAQLLGRELNVPIDNDVVWLALAQLKKANLLAGEVKPPLGATKISRRELTRRIGIAALVLPAITALSVPAAAQAASGCAGAACESNFPLQCCSQQQFCVLGACSATGPPP